MIYLIYLTGILIVIASVCLVISMDKKKNANLRKKMLFVAIICQLLIFTFIFIMLNTAFSCTTHRFFYIIDYGFGSVVQLDRTIVS